MRTYKLTKAQTEDLIRKGSIVVSKKGLLYPIQIKYVPRYKEYYVIYDFNALGCVHLESLTLDIKQYRLIAAAINAYLRFEYIKDNEFGRELTDTESTLYVLNFETYNSLYKQLKKK